MIVDDDPVIRTLISDIAESAGHTVEAFEKGEDCLHSMDNALPDVLILDLQMPGMNGIDVLKQLRQNTRTAGVPVIMLSANSDSPMVLDQSVHADLYLQKPFKVAEFLSVLDKK